MMKKTFLAVTVASSLLLGSSVSAASPVTSAFDLLNRAKSYSYDAWVTGHSSVSMPGEETVQTDLKYIMKGKAVALGTPKEAQQLNLGMEIKNNSFQELLGVDTMNLGWEIVITPKTWYFRLTKVAGGENLAMLQLFTNNWYKLDVADLKTFLKQATADTPDSAVVIDALLDLKTQQKFRNEFAKYDIASNVKKLPAVKVAGQDAERWQFAPDNNKIPQALNKALLTTIGKTINEKDKAALSQFLVNDMKKTSFKNGVVAVAKNKKAVSYDLYYVTNDQDEATGLKTTSANRMIATYNDINNPKLVVTEPKNAVNLKDLIAQFSAMVAGLDSATGTEGLETTVSQ